MSLWKDNGNSQARRIGRSVSVAMALASCVALTGCVVTTDPYGDGDRTARVSADLESMFADQEPVSGSLSMEESFARALLYNLDHKVEMMEEVVANHHIDVSRTDLLPRIAASAGYNHRSNDAGGRSQSLLSGEESLEPSTSQERSHRLIDFQVAWNVLDFGVSYMTARQRQDEVRMIEERRRKVVQNIAFEIVNAYSLAWIAQKYGPQTEELVGEINEAVASYDRLIKKKLHNQKDGLLSQRRLLDTQNQLLELIDGMAIAQTRLGRLMNLRPGTRFELDSPGFEVSETPMEIDVEELEITALNMRPELREEDYAKRISHTETRKELLRMFPGLEFSIGGHRDGNKFLFNRSWADTGIRLSWNLLNLVNGPRMRELRKSEEDLADARRRALSMSVMTQVRLAAQHYQVEQKKLAQTTRLAEVDSSLYKLVNGAKLTRTRFDVIQAKAAWLISQIREELSKAEVQNAMARVLDSLGMDPVPDTISEHSVESLSKAIRARWNMLSKHYFASYDSTEERYKYVRSHPDATPKSSSSHIEDFSTGWSVEVLD